MVPHSPVISESHVSITQLMLPHITVPFSAMFTLLHISTNRELFKTSSVNQSSHYKIWIVLCAQVVVCIHYTSLSAMLN